MKTLKRYGYSDEADAHGDPLLTLRFGEGMGGIWGAQTRVALDGKAAEPSPCRAFAIRE